MNPLAGLQNGTIEKGDTMYRFTWMLAACGVMLAAPAGAGAETQKLDAAARASAIDGVLKRVRDGYVFPDVGRKMEEAVRERVAKKEYDGIEDGEALAATLTSDLRAVSRDLHLHVSYSAEVLPPEPPEPLKPSPAEMEEMRRNLAKENYGVPKVEILKGNVGYMRWNYFVSPEIAAETYAAAMNYVANTDALILDLRGCMGSMSIDAIPMLCSYFFASPVHLIDVSWRGEKSGPRQVWTWAHVPGKRYLEKPIYVLTSGKTFSGAEEMAYDLKNLKRATLIGETTGGGANGGGSRRASDHFSVWVPSGHVVSPITKTNWEGTGVAPDVAVPAVNALYTAHLTALKKLAVETSDERWKQVLASEIATLEANPPRLKKATFTLKGHPDAREVMVAGTFNHWSARGNPMRRKGDAWVAEVEAEPGSHAYKFVVDGKWILDPANPQTTMDGRFENSARVIE
jgi:hypothetical protein